MRTLLIAATVFLSVTSFAPVRQTQYVYICTSKGTKVYHNSSTCKMLKGCKGEVKQITKHDALTKYGRTPCKVCCQ
ncbi:MAG TPA: hypothetical protein VK806_12200 [Bacteroidia bacterium]|jgi:hypothetical protein|nr:hypothetical protein [Bacteroidia bacterium]